MYSNDLKEKCPSLALIHPAFGAGPCQDPTARGASMVGACSRAVTHLVLGAATAIFLLLAIVSPVSGRESADLVSHIEISTRAYKLELAMDAPITAEVAARHERELRKPDGGQSLADGPVSMGCGAVFSPLMRMEGLASNGSAI